MDLSDPAVNVVMNLIDMSDNGQDAVRTLLQAVLDAGVKLGKEEVTRS